MGLICYCRNYNNELMFSGSEPGDARGDTLGSLGAHRCPAVFLNDESHPVPKKVIELYRKIARKVSKDPSSSFKRARSGVGNLSLGMLHAVGIRIATTLSGTTARMKLLDIINPREIRRRLGLNQEEFWTSIGGSPKRGLSLRERP